MQDNSSSRSAGLFSDAQIHEASRLFAMLSEPARLLILRSLFAAPSTVSGLVAATGLKQGTVSKHLGLLSDARLVRGERQGTFVRYGICDPLIKKLCSLVCERIEKDARVRYSELVPKASRRR